MQTGEEVLSRLTNNQFAHNEQSIRGVGKLENKGRGLNLTYEVREGILHQQSKSRPETLEGKVVQLSDKIAYINHDIDDAIRGKVLSEEDLPKKTLGILGNTSSKRINTLITNIIYESKDKNTVQMSADVRQAFLDLRKFLFANVYIGSLAKVEEEKAKHVVEELFQYYMTYPKQLPENYQAEIAAGASVMRSVCDYIAGMTDRFAIHQYCELFFPAAWKIY